VKQLNRSLSQSAKEATIGADALMNLSRRTNDYFTQFVGAWLKSDSIASHFVFELGGFEFLLDTIGKKEESTEKTTPKVVAEARPMSQSVQIDSSMGGQKDEDKLDASSDIYSLLYNQTEDEADPDPKEKAEEESELPLDEPPQLVLGELATKQLVLTEDNTGGAVASPGKVDWSGNKRAYKHRLMVTGLQGALKSEYWVLFKLQQTALLKEI
jgi:hypothetical protein